MLSVCKTRITVDRCDRSVAGCVNFDRAVFRFSPDWAGTSRYALFWRGRECYRILLDETDSCLIPWELLQKEGCFQIGAVGTRADGTVIATETPVVQSVAPGAERSGRPPEPPTPTLYAQLASAVAGAVEAFDRLEQRADRGEFNGDPGPQGPTGETGPKGDDGKSAYEQVAEAGYPGTEEEFLDGLAELPYLMDRRDYDDDGAVDEAGGISAYVAAHAVPQTFTAVYGTTTYGEIAAACAAGKRVGLHVSGSPERWMDLVKLTETEAVFGSAEDPLLVYAKCDSDDLWSVTQVTPVSTGRTVNGHDLSADLTLTASDVGALDSVDAGTATDLTGLVKGNGASLSAAVAGTDYAPAYQYGTTDIGVGASLAAGTLYFVFEEA